MRSKILILSLIIITVLVSSGCTRYDIENQVEGNEIRDTPTSGQTNIKEPQSVDKPKIEKIYDINIYEVFVTLSTYCALHGGANLENFQGGTCDEFDTLILRTSFGNETAERLLFDKYGQYAEKLPMQKSTCTYENAQYHYGNFTLKRAQCFHTAYKMGIFVDPLDEDEGVMQDCRFYSCIMEEKKSCLAIPTSRIDGRASSKSECDNLCEMYTMEPGEHEIEPGGVVCICCEYVKLPVMP